MFRSLVEIVLVATDMSEGNIVGTLSYGKFRAETAVLF